MAANRAGTKLIRGMADIEPGMRLHHVTAGEGDRTAVLLLGDMMREVAADVSEFRVPRTGHWIVEENPDALLEHLRSFLK